MRISILSLMLVASSALVSATVPPRPAPKQNSIIGAVVAYDYFDNLMLLTFVKSRVVLIVRTQPPKGDKSRLIQVAYDYFGSAQPTKYGFPNELIDHVRQWRFKLVRDTNCDHPVQEFTPLQRQDLDTGKNTEERMPLWKLIPGAETEKIPFGETLPCYSLKVGGYKPYRK